MEMFTNISVGIVLISAAYGIYAILRLLICFIKGNEKQAWIKKIKIVVIVILGTFLLSVLVNIAEDGIAGIIIAIACIIFLIGLYMLIKLLISLFKGQDRMKYFKRTSLCGILFIVLAAFAGSMDKSSDATAKSQVQQNSNLNQQQNQPQQTQQQSQQNQDQFDNDFDRDKNSKNKTSQQKSNEPQTQNTKSNSQSQQTQPQQKNQTQPQPKPQVQPKPNAVPNNVASSSSNKSVSKAITNGVKKIGRALIKAKFHI